MVNVNKHEIFPTVIYQFNCGFDDLNQLDITQMNAFILSNEKEDIVNQSKDGELPNTRAPISIRFRVF